MIKSDEFVNFSLGHLKSMLSKMINSMEKFEDIFDHLVLEAEQNEREEIIESFNMTQQDFFDASILYHAQVERKFNLRETPSSISTNSQFSSRIKLPPIEVHKYNGTPEAWLPFRDLFLAMIHNNDQLSGSQKYRYWKTSITDKFSPVKFDIAMLDTKMRGKNDK